MAAAKNETICRICRRGKGKCMPGFQPSATARNSVGMTTESYVKYRCRGIRPYDGGTWRALIDEFTENHFTWISRPLIRGTASASLTEPAEPANTGTGNRGTLPPYFDALLGRYYNEVEMEQVQREIGEANTQKKCAKKPVSCRGTTAHRDVAHRSS